MQGARRAGAVAAALKAHSRHKKHFIPEHDDPLRQMLDEDTDHQTATAVRLEKLDRILTEKSQNGLVTIDPAVKQSLIREKQIDGLMHRVEDRLDRTHHYHSCLALTVFITFFVIVMTLQNDVRMAYSIESTMLNSVIGSLDTETFALKSTDEFYEWFGSELVDRVFRDPICGDGICEQPHEFPSVGRFGCQLDCGLFLQSTSISIKLETFPMWTKLAQGQWDLSKVKRRVTPQFKWNLFSHTLGEFLFDEDQLPDITVVTDVPDGKLTLHMYQTEIISTQVDEKSIYDYLYMTQATLPTRQAKSDFDYGDKREAIASGSILLKQLFDYCWGGSMSMDDLDSFDMGCVTYPDQDTQIRVFGSYGLQGQITTANGTRDKTVLADVGFCGFVPNGVEGIRNTANKAWIQEASVDCGARRDLDMVPEDQPSSNHPSARPLPKISREVYAALKERLDREAGDWPREAVHSAERKLAQLVASPLWGPCIQHSDCDQSQFDRFSGYPGMFCDAVGSCQICSFCQLDGVHAINNLCPQSFCPGSGNYPGCISAEALASNWSCPSTHDFEVWTYNEPGTSVEVKEPPKPQLRYVTPFNKLVGAIMVTQTRRTPSNCTEVINEFVQAFSTADPCISDAKDGTPYGLDPVFLPTSGEYDGKLSPEDFFSDHERMQLTFKKTTTEGETVTEKIPSNPLGFFPHQYDTVLREEKKSSLIWEEGVDTFKQFFDERVTAERAQQMLNYMKDGRWIDGRTTDVEVEFVTFNADLNRFTFVGFEFRWQPGGSILWNYRLQTIAMDIYDVDWGTAQFVGEIFCMLMLGMNVLTELMDISICLRTYQIRQYLSAPGNWFDWAHFILMIASWVAWLQHWRRTDTFTMMPSYPVIHDLSNSARFFQTNAEAEVEFLEFMKDVRTSADMVAEYSAFSSICIVLFVLRMLKALDFQPRMGVVTQTIAHSLVDVIHFLMLWSLVFIGYACVGTLLFGHQFRSFSTVQNACITIGSMILTMDRTVFYEQMAHAAPGWAFHMYLWSWLILAFFLLINIFLAILVDSYATLKSQADVTTGVHTELMELGWDWARRLLMSKKRFMTDQRLLETLASQKSGLPSTYQLREAVVTSLDYKEQILLPGGVEVGLHSMRRLVNKPRERMEEPSMVPKDDGDEGDSSEEEADKDIEWTDEKEKDRVEDLMERFGAHEVHGEDELLDMLRVDSMKRAVSLFRHQQWLLGKVDRLDLLLARLAGRHRSFVQRARQVRVEEQLHRVHLRLLHPCSCSCIFRDKRCDG
mmetsp:Transcript_40849/g.83567  ORF Transcript_40849/g.83567 Transcript_40849/m.83567 type:complete len:1272 (-) Transcript_40849:1118-4933(-)